MANNYSNKGLTGKSGRKMVNHGVSHLMVPVVAQAALEKKADTINDATISGKQRGAVVLQAATAAGNALSLCVATGSKEDALWASVALADVVTPA